MFSPVGYVVIVRLKYIPVYIYTHTLCCLPCISTLIVLLCFYLNAWISIVSSLCAFIDLGYFSEVLFYLLVLRVFNPWMHKFSACLVFHLRSLLLVKVISRAFLIYFKLIMAPEFLSNGRVHQGGGEGKGREWRLHVSSRASGTREAGLVVLRYLWERW